MRFQGILSLLVLVLHTTAATPASPNQINFELSPNESSHQWSEMGGLRLISTSEDHREWMNAEQILGLIRNKKNFVDVTEGYLDALDTLKPLAKLGRVVLQWAEGRPPPTDVKHQGLVVPILKMISEASMERFLTKFSSFNTRYYLSRSGLASTNWLYSQIKQLLVKHRSRHYKASVRLVKHNFPQPSIIVRIEPVSDDPNVSIDSNPIVIVGSHHDSVSSLDPMNGRAPGADDDGSGTTTIFEALRVILESKVLDPRSGWSKPIEYHWYAAEEAGLLGSQAVAAEYRQKDVNVYAMWQCDMTGYTSPNNEAVISLIGDYADPSFNDFVKKLARSYSKLRAEMEKRTTGYGGSDHFSWTMAGYAAVWPFEAPFNISNRYVHTTNDSVANINFSHMTEFVKTIIGWTIELSFD
ncbi:hypothetical protein BJ742DRAFT_744691 [Cladochytrium replicatum]|nr:hypothetical protein BJ742DRAFT_744691 [Cladochytrium replicatum]